MTGPKSPKTVESPPSTYITSYCNQPHKLSDGKPVEHECRVIPPAALQAEKNGDFEQAIELIEASPAKTHRGVKAAQVICKLCRHKTQADTAHRHQDAWVGECCWDERLRTTE